MVRIGMCAAGINLSNHKARSRDVPIRSQVSVSDIFSTNLIRSLCNITLAVVNGEHNLWQGAAVNGRTRPKCLQCGSISLNVLQTYSVVKHIHWIDFNNFKVFEVYCATVLSRKIEVSDRDSVSADIPY